ncbi:MAG: ribose 5-phosphate isomerase B [Flavobacteriales bacterium]|jgi:ribose 5-phosphate isomerase B|nr:ribose 5-phosphate isomerase B [Flavobacteriales bacterium]|tara:strand:+ start:3142 stop:3576 length:435 start_codon:yes stop_codon:yes gene_type:complete
MSKKIGLACDHAGFDYKERVVKYLEDKGYTVNDYGCFSTDSVDYPDFAHQLAISIEEGTNDLGIQFCGSGNGINMSANKHQAIRSALCWEVDIAELARLHNDANICTMPARFISFEKAIDIIDVFLKTNFEGGRHQKRVNKISC